jgi:DNA-binding GntR family transcriptional regulator
MDIGAPLQVCVHAVIRSPDRDRGVRHSAAETMQAEAARQRRKWGFLWYFLRLWARWSGTSKNIFLFPVLRNVEPRWRRSPTRAAPPHREGGRMKIDERGGLAKHRAARGTVARGSQAAGSVRKLVAAKRKGARLLAKSLFPDREIRSLTAGVARALRNDIVRGAYLPNAKLKIADLAEFYGVSPGAVREALSRLVSEGLVEFTEQRGFRAAPVSETALIDITKTRILIECEALRLAIRHGSSAWEKEVIENNRLLSKAPLFKRGVNVVDSDWALLHRRFHRSLLEPCGSEWLLRFQTILFEQTERYRALEGLAPKRVVRFTRDVVNEHEAIARAVVTRDQRTATKLLEEHYMRTVEVLCQNREALMASVD